ncbi:MAG: tRNA (guanosine(37)-N1)-methyltransferase TrmD [Desulfosarcinaceae bacterium]|nr:tRNA (guanosine(37)-N1)-methyltransferase TrmD [Desulfosarcinaceae bacterium]
MQIRVLTLFPELFDGFWANGMIKRAVAVGRLSPETINIRSFATDRHQVTDDRPYGGGAGMVMKPEPLAAAIRQARSDLKRASGSEAADSTAIFMSPQGRLLNQDLARQLAGQDNLIFVCGRYEGVDERVIASDIDLELSIGEYVLTGGEVAAMVVIDAVTRLLPGVLGNADSTQVESFSDHRLENAHYTRPREFEGVAAPEVLLSGNHQAIDDWRRESALVRTLLKRPDLLRRQGLTTTEKAILRRWRREWDHLD